MPTREKPLSGEEGLQRIALHAVAGGCREGGFGDGLARHNALEGGIHRCQNQAGLFGWPVQLGERRKPARQGIGGGRYTVIGQAIPGGKTQDFQIGREIGDLLGKGGQALVVDADVEQRDIGHVPCQLRQEHCIKALGHARQRDAAGYLQARREL